MNEGTAGDPRLEKLRSELEAERARRQELEAELREADERYRLVVEGAADYAIVLLDPAGRFASWSEGARRLVGYSAEEVLGRPAALLFTPEDRARGLPERELRVAAEAGRYEDENWTVRKDGSRFWSSGISRALRNDGTLRGYVKVFRDLTERQQAQEALRESEQRLTAALAAARMGTWHWDIAADRQSLDEPLQRLLGLPPGREVTGLEGFLALIHPDDRAAVADAFRRSAEEGARLDAEFRVVWPDGSVRWLRDQGDVVPGPGGRPASLTGACVDITDRKWMEEALRAADRRKDEFLAMLGHELRNPLAPLRSGVEILRTGYRDGPAAERLVAIMGRQVEHLARLVDDLLDVARVTRGAIALRRAPMDLAVAVGQAAEMAGPLLEGRGHELAVALPRTPLRVEGDATRLTQVVFNLLANAAKYTDPGGKVWLGAQREGGEAVLRVRDNGAGMPADLLPRVFDLFARGEQGPDRAQGGLGLGLSLVRRLAEMHGGSVEAHSAGPGRGSEFVVRLPALPPEPGERRPPPAPARQAPAVRSVDRVLVVDDNPDVAESLVMLLDGLAREVRVAHSGPEALELARGYRPEVVLLDLGMPGMDGYETARHLRREHGPDEVLVAAVSGYGQEEDRRRSKQAGFDVHLVKPIGRADLVELLRKVPQGG